MATNQPDFYENNLIERRISGETIAETPEQKSELFRQFFETDLGSTFYEDYGLDTKNPATGQTNAQMIEQIFLKLYADDHRMTLSRVTDAVQTAIQAGALVKPPEPIVATPRRTEDGKFANSHQRLREEVRRMIDDPTVSSAAIRQRADSDKAFGDAFRAEVSNGAVKTSGSYEIPSAAIKSFVVSFRAEPNPKFLGGYIKIGSEQYTKAQFDAQIAEASRFNLL